MPVYSPATSFELRSLDHDDVLLSSEIGSIRNLLGTESLEDTPKTLNFEFTVGGQQISRVLRREKGSIAEGAKLKLGGENGEITEKEMPKVYNYYSEDRKWLLNFHNHEKVEGLISEGNHLIHFTTENGVLKVDEKAIEVFGGKNLRNLSEIEANIDYWADCHAIQPNMSELRIGAGIGFLMYSNYGESGSVALVNSYLAQSNMIYEPQMDVSLQVGDVLIATSGNFAQWTDNTCSMDIHTQLNKWRSSSKPSTQDLWHLFEDCYGVYNTVLGVAYVGTLCSSSSNVGTNYLTRYTDLYPTLNLAEYPTWATVAHEIGHNFNAQHSFEEGQGSTGGIMDYGWLSQRLINGVIQFNTQYRKREVCQHVSKSVNNGCISEVAEEFEVAERKATLRNLKCVEHKHRAVGADDALFVARGGFTKAQCRAMCDSEPACNSFTWGRLGHCETWGDKGMSDLYYASEFDTFFCAQEEAPKGALAEKTLDDLLDLVDIAKSQEKCCGTLDHQFFAGINKGFQQDVSKAKCFRNCITDSKCEAATWDSVDESCMYFGKNDVEGFDMNEVISTPGAFSLGCERQCLDNFALGVEMTESGSGSGMVVAGLFGGVAVLGAAAAIYAFFRKPAKATDESCNN